MATRLASNVVCALNQILATATEPLSARELCKRVFVDPMPADWWAVCGWLETKHVHAEFGVMVAVRSLDKREWLYCRKALYERLFAARRIVVTDEPNRIPEIHDWWLGEPGRAGKRGRVHV